MLSADDFEQSLFIIYICLLIVAFEMYNQISHDWETLRLWHATKSKEKNTVWQRLSVKKLFLGNRKNWRKFKKNNKKKHLINMMAPAENLFWAWLST